jgi:RNA polymerase sigma-54 factor
MSSLSPRLSLGVAQKQILTPSLVQMVKLLQLNRLELVDYVSRELAENPVLEEAEIDEATQEEVQAALEAERVQDPADAELLGMMDEPLPGLAAGREEGIAAAELDAPSVVAGNTGSAPGETPETSTGDPEAGDSSLTFPESALDSFDQIDFGAFFDDYLDPGFKSPAGEAVEKPAFEEFLSSPLTLADHLDRQLTMLVLSANARRAAEGIIGNLDENGYLTVSLEEIASQEVCSIEEAAAGLRTVQSLDPLGVGARDLRECLLIQLESRGGRDGVAWRMVDGFLAQVQGRQFKEIARALGRPLDHVETGFAAIRGLDPRPGLRYSGPASQKIEPDVYIFKDGAQYVVQLNDDEVPQLRLSSSYRRMLDSGQPNGQEAKDARGYIRERYNSALQLLKNIEQRKQTILKVCHSIVARQGEMFDRGIDALRPMMIKDVAEEIGVHPSTVSRAVARKYAHTPLGVFELRFFFSEAVQGAHGAETPLLVLKRRVKKMIEEEDPAQPLTDEQITARLLAERIVVTRRTVAKYREDMKIPSTHQRRRRAGAGPGGSRS